MLSISSERKRFKHTQIHQCHHQILLLASKADIQKLMSLYHTVWQEDPNKVIRVIPLNRFLSEDMESIVRSYFAESTCKGRHSSQKGDLEDPILLSLAQEEALIVIGTKKIVEQVRSSRNSWLKMRPTLPSQGTSLRARHSSSFSILDNAQKPGEYT